MAIKIRAIKLSIDDMKRVPIVNRPSIEPLRANPHILRCTAIMPPTSAIIDRMIPIAPQTMIIPPMPGMIAAAVVPINAT